MTDKKQESINMVQTKISNDLEDAIMAIKNGNYTNITLADDCNNDTYDEDLDKYYDVNSDLYQVGLDMDKDINNIQNNNDSYKAIKDIKSKLPLLINLHNEYKSEPENDVLIDFD